MLNFQTCLLKIKKKNYRNVHPVCAVKFPKIRYALETKKSRFFVSQLSFLQKKWHTTKFTPNWNLVLIQNFYILVSRHF